MTVVAQKNPSPTELLERIDQDLREAIRSRDAIRRETLRLIRSAVRYEDLSRDKPLSDADIFAVLQRQVKQRRDSIEQFRQGKRQDLVDKEEAELAVILQYLPQQLSREEIVRLAQQVITEVGAAEGKDKGKVMGRLMPQVRGKADGALVNTVVTELLESVPPR